MTMAYHTYDGNECDVNGDDVNSILQPFVLGLIVQMCKSKKNAKKLGAIVNRTL